MLSKISIAFLFAVLLQAPAFMPRVWVDASPYRVKPNEKITINVYHREKLQDVNYPVKRSDFVKGSIQSKQGAADILPIIPSEEQGKFDVTLAGEGTHLLGLRTTPILITLSADSINAFAKEFDLEDVVYARTSKKLLDKSAKVMASWHASVLLQAGAQPDDTYKKSSGYPLEIVVAQNPYAMKIGEKVKFTILWNGKPLFGARVIVRITADRNTGVQHIYSGKDGVIEAPLGSRGTWVVMVSKMVPSRNADADWQSYQASLSFGY